MTSLSSLGIGLSVVFGCLFLALVAELYYLFCWKKRITDREDIEEEEDYTTSAAARESFYLFCWKKRPFSSSSLFSSTTSLNPRHQELCNSVRRITDTHDSSTSAGIDFLLKPAFGGGEESIESELMRLHNLSGPPRFLFTIKEETREDLEAEDGKSERGVDRSKKGSRSRSLSDLILQMETPFFTPLSSPPFFTPPLTPMDNYSSNLGFGFNPLFESSSDAEINRMMMTKSSPPPKFKFLKDAEEKLYRRTMMMEEEEEAEKIDDHGCIEEVMRTVVSPTPSTADEDRDGSFITILVAGNKKSSAQQVHDHPQYRYISQNHHPSSSSSSQVLPLATSPSEIRPPVLNMKPMFHFH